MQKLSFDTASFIALNSKQQEITQNLKVGLKVIKTQKCGCPSGHISQEILVARHKFLVVPPPRDVSR